MKKILIFVTVFLSGCMPVDTPILKKTQDAYRVDPVVVEARKRATHSAECGYSASSDKTSNEADSKAPCAIDIDTYRFPDMPSDADDTAYSRLLSCEKSAASSFNLGNLRRLKVINEYKKDLLEKSVADEGKTYEKYQQELEYLIGKKEKHDNSIKELAALNSQIDSLKKSKSGSKDARKKAGLLSKKSIVEAWVMTEAQLQALNSEVVAKEKSLAGSKEKLDKVEAELASASASTDNAQIDFIEANLVRAVYSEDPETCRMLRNRLQDEIITRSQSMCKKHLADISATSAVLNTDLGLASIAFSTLGAVVGGASAKSIYSGLAGATGAAQTLANKEIYRDYVVPAIVRAINTDRDRKIQEIKTDQTKDVVTYSSSRSITDVIDFHERCSFAHGLVLLSGDAEKRTPPRIEELQAQIAMNYDMIQKAQESIHEHDEDGKDGKHYKESTAREKEIVQRTVERLRHEIDGIMARINLMKRAQSPN